MTEEDSYFSFLPLAHVFDQIMENYCIFKGASIGYWRGVGTSQPTPLLNSFIIIIILIILDLLFCCFFPGCSLLNGGSPRIEADAILRRPENL